MISTSLLRLLVIALTVLIAVIPLWYPRYSFFRREADVGIEQLKGLDQEVVIDNNGRQVLQRTGELTPSDKGFRQVSRTLVEQTHIREEPTEVRLVQEKDANGSGISFGPGGVRRSNQAGLLVVYESGQTEAVIEPAAFETEQILELNELHRWVRNQANRRSHYWTTVLAVLWGTISTVLVL